MSANVPRRAVLRGMGVMAMSAGGFGRSFAQARQAAP
jgi:hypothetical protein